MFILRRILCLMFMLFTSAVHADVVIAPPDLDVILKKVSERQSDFLSPEQSAKITYKDKNLIFEFPSEETNLSISFQGQSSTIIKNIRMKRSTENYRFTVFLKPNGEDYKSLVRQVNQKDALIFFNDTDIFVYTQNLNENKIDLEEWIYARKPNSPQGSQWEWVFKSASWEWPMTLTAGTNGEVKINRNVPVPGMVIDRKAKDNYLLQMMIKFKNDDQIKNYFPFPEEIGSLPPANVMNKERISRQVDVSLFNSPVINENRVKPKHGLDFSGWDDYWQSIYTQSVTASPEEYPLLIGPFK